MKLIIAMIQPSKLPDVKQALFDAEVYKMTVSNVLGCGQQKGYPETYRGITIDEVNLLKKIKLEIAVNEDFVERTIEAIKKGAYSGKIGDGKIFVLDLPRCIRIRTGEEGSEAIG
ncbi:MAG: P-II family nitrogen regulator [Candidatus Humimicrobiaceae bacterium]